MQTSLEEKPVYTVLLVEPDPVERTTIYAMLVQKGYAVYTAENHKKALAMLDTMPFSVLLCCASPRRMTCEEFAQEAKSYQPFLSVIVLASTDEYTDLDFSESVDKVLNEPLSIDEIDRAIQELTI